MDKQNYDIAIIGGGIVGLATAFKICSRWPELCVAILEKEDDVGRHQTGRNSGVIHSGIYYRPGSAKAHTCTQGRRELVHFAKEHSIAHNICGKVIVATEEREMEHLERIYQHGRANEVEGICRIEADGIQQFEPFCRGIAGIHVPCTGVIDYVQVMRKCAELVEELNSKNRLFLRAKLQQVQRRGTEFRLRTTAGDVCCRYAINCAGLHCDRVAKQFGLQPNVRIVPFRGDYYELHGLATEKVRSLIYPVPDPQFPFLGVHFTRDIYGAVECGPNAVFSFKREGYTKTAFSLKDTFDSLTFPGTIKMFAKHWKFGYTEYRRAFSKKLFLHALQRLIPSIEAADLKPGKAGVRAQAVDRHGKPVDDFRIDKHENSLHVLNAPSPAATACLAIGEHIAEVAGDHFELT